MKINKLLKILAVTAAFSALSAISALAGQWQEVQDNGWRYLGDDNQYVTGWQQLEWNGVPNLYYFSAEGVMQTGWVLEDGKWYFLYESGARAADCWVQVNNDLYYLGQDGVLLVNTTSPDGYLVDGNGAKIVNGWREDLNGRWYQYGGGTRFKNCWKIIEGKRYYFNDQGYVLTGFQTIDNKEYYFNKSGAVITSDFTLNEIRYYVNEEGAIIDKSSIDNLPNGDSIYNANFELEGDGFSQSMAEELCSLINRQRANRNLEELTFDESVMELAMIRAEEIAGKASHTRPDGRSYRTVFEDYDMSYTRLSELYTSGQDTAKDAVKIWVDNATDKSTLLNTRYDSCGIGCFRKDGVMYWTLLIFSN